MSACAGLSKQLPEGSSGRQPGRGRSKALNGNAAAFVPSQPSTPSSPAREASQPPANGDLGHGSYASKPAASYRNAALGAKGQNTSSKGQPGSGLGGPPGHQSLGSTESGTPPASPSARGLANGHRRSVDKPQTPQPSQVRSTWSVSRLAGTARQPGSDISYSSSMPMKFILVSYQAVSASAANTATNKLPARAGCLQPAPRGDQSHNWLMPSSFTKHGQASALVVEYGCWSDICV